MLLGVDTQRDRGKESTMKVHARQLFTALGVTLVAALLAIPTALGASGVRVERLSDGRASTIPLVTDHGGQNRGPAIQDLGPLDPWAYALVHRSAPVQNLGPLDPWAVHLVHPNGLTAASAPVSASVESPGFMWRDAGIGAGVTIGAMLLIAAGAMLLRRRRGVAHAH
jgi:hypothetical protein